MNNLATAQVRKDTPSLIDMKGFGRPKEMSGKEGKCSAVAEEGGGVLCKESEMMLVWVSLTGHRHHARAHRSGVPANFDERGARSAQSGFRGAAVARKPHGSHEL